MKTSLVLLPIIIASLTSMSLAEERVSYFRRHGGVVTDDARRLPAELGSKANLVWRQPLGPGHSTPCIAEDVIFVTTHQGKELATLALDRETGELRWRRTVVVDESSAPEPFWLPFDENLWRLGELLADAQLMRIEGAWRLPFLLKKRLDRIRKYFR